MLYKNLCERINFVLALGFFVEFSLTYEIGVVGAVRVLQVNQNSSFVAVH